MWLYDEQERRVFSPGQEDYSAAARMADVCESFRPDVDEEWVADESRSCYNCRLRRWTADSFVCLGSPRIRSEAGE